MSSLTSGSPGIGDTGSGNAAYFSGLVMMDVMMSFWKGRSVRCILWDSLFYLSYLLLGDLCRADWHVTMLVPFSSLFYLLCLSCLFMTRGLQDLCVVVAKFVQRGLLRRCRCYLEIFTFFIVFVLIFCVQRGLLRRRCCDSEVYTFFIVFVVIFRGALIGASMPRLPSVFSFILL